MDFSLYSYTYLYDMQKSVIIIGAGMGGLAAACLLARGGYKVTVYDNNEQPGGRNSIFKEKGFTFNRGPSWYLMPGVFEHFYKNMGENIADHLTLQRLTPGYRVFFKDTLFGAIDIYGDRKRDGQTFESFEPGAKNKLNSYLRRSEELYNMARDEILYENIDSARELLSPKLMRAAVRLRLLSSMHKNIAKDFKSRELQKILEYPSVFLGGSPYNIPALYSVLNHVNFDQGVFYPKGGMDAVAKSLAALAKKHGAKITCNATVTGIITKDGRATGVELASGKTVPADIVISGAGIENTEQNLLPASQRMYSKRYWKTRTLAPSALLIHLGISGALPELQHHNLIFSKKWKLHFDSLFKKKTWLADPSIYICNPTKSDSKLAPKGHENVTILVPIAPGLSYTDETLNIYADHILQVLEKTLHLDNLNSRIVCRRLFCVKDFEVKYHAPKGTALGLSHTLRQTATGRPSNKHQKIHNLYFVGADTAPGIGVPMCLISAELVAKRLGKG